MSHVSKEAIMYDGGSGYTTNNSSQLNASSISTDNRVVSLDETKVDSVVSILNSCNDRIERMAEDLISWDAQQYASVSSSKYIYLYPTRFRMGDIDVCEDSYRNVISEFLEIVQTIKNYSNTVGDTLMPGVEGNVNTDETVTGNDDGILEFVDNKDGTFTDENGNKYVKVDKDGDGIADSYVMVTDSDGDGVLEDGSGNKYVKVDENGDGVADSYVMVTDSDGDGVLEDDSGNKYVKVDENGDGVADSYVIVTDSDGDGVLEDSSGNKYVKVDENGDGVTDNYVIVTDSDGDGVLEDSSGNKYIKVDSDGDGVADNYVKVTDDNANGDNKNVASGLTDNTNSDGTQDPKNDTTNNVVSTDDIISNIVPGSENHTVEKSQFDNNEHVKNNSLLDETTKVEGVSGVVGETFVDGTGTALVNKTGLISHANIEKIKNSGVVGFGGAIGVGAAVVGGSTAIGGSIYGGAAYYRKKKEEDEEDNDDEEDENEEKKKEEDKLDVLQVKEQLVELGEVVY